MKSEKLKIQITPSNQRPRAEILICIFHFLLFTFHLSKSVPNPLQIRCKSDSNPIPVWELEDEGIAQERASGNGTTRTSP